MDASVNGRVTEMLIRLGWDVETAEQAHLTGKIDDTKWVKHARAHKRIAITFDDLKAEQGAKVSRELRRRGGKIIRISMGKRQDAFRSVGKLLYHYSRWCPFLRENDGVSIVFDINPQKCQVFTPEEYHQNYHHLDAELFTKFLLNRKNKPYRPRKHKPRIAPENQGLL